MEILLKELDLPDPERVRIDRLIVLSRFSQWWCMAAFGRWSDLFGWFRQRTRSKLPSRSQDCLFRQQSLVRFRPSGDHLRWASSLQDSLLFAQGEILGNSRSVMLLNVLGDTRTTMSVRTRNPAIWPDPLDSIEGGITGITSTQLGPRIAIIGRATRNVS